MTVATANLFEGLIPGAKPAGTSAAAPAAGAPAVKATDASSFDAAMANAVANVAAKFAGLQTKTAAAAGVSGDTLSDDLPGLGDDASAAALLLLAANGPAAPLPPAFPPAAAAAERALQAVTDKGTAATTQGNAAAALAAETTGSLSAAIFAEDPAKSGATVALPSATVSPPALGLGGTPPQSSGLPITPAEVTPPFANDGSSASGLATAAAAARAKGSASEATSPTVSSATAAKGVRSDVPASVPLPPPQAEAPRAPAPARPELTIVRTSPSATEAGTKALPAVSGPLAGELVVAASESAPALSVSAAANEASRPGRTRTASSATPADNASSRPSPSAATTPLSSLTAAASGPGATDPGPGAVDAESGAEAAIALSDLAERGLSKGRERTGDGAVQTGNPAAAARTGGAQHAQLRGAEAAARPQHPPAPPVVDQVVVHLRTAIRNGIDRLDIQLKPAALGHITMKLDMSADGRVSAVITADRPETLHLLQRDARGLERALQDAGLQTNQGSLSFNLRGEGQGAGQHHDPTGGFGSGFAQSDARLDFGAGSESGNETDPLPPARPRAALDRALDIEV